MLISPNLNNTHPRSHTQMNTPPPTPNDITVFLNTFAKLDQFEAEHRARSGWGVWHQDTLLPIPEVARVIKWLRTLLTQTN